MKITLRLKTAIIKVTDLKMSSQHLSLSARRHTNNKNSEIKTLLLNNCANAERDFIMHLKNKVQMY